MAHRPRTIFGGNPGSRHVRVSVTLLLGLRLGGGTAILRVGGSVLPGVCLIVTILRHQRPRRSALLNAILVILIVVIVSYYAAFLRRRGPHIALHSVYPSVRLSVRLSVRPVIAYFRTSVTCFRQPCGRAVSFVLFTCQGHI